MRDAGIYTISSMILLKNKNINTTYNYNYEWAETTHSNKQILTADNIKLTIQPLYMDTVLWYALKEYGNADKAVTTVEYLPQSEGHVFENSAQARAEAESYHRLTLYNMLSVDYNSFAIDFIQAITRQTGEDVGKYAQYFDLDEINSAVRNNYNIGVQGFEYDRDQMFFEADDVTSNVYTFNDLFEIRRAHLTFTWTPEGEGTAFDGEERGYKVTVTGLKSSGGLSIYADSERSRLIKSVTASDNEFYVTQKNAGAYQVTLYENSNNYDFAPGGAYTKHLDHNPQIPYLYLEQLRFGDYL